MALYNYGMIVGRFQMLHNGHKRMIDTALELCEKVVIYIGSSQVSRTERNPFTYEERASMIEKVIKTYVENPQRVIIRPLPDIGVGNNDIWGRYILGLFEGEFNSQPNLYITGYENIRSSWFNPNIAPNLNELILSKGVLNVSASKCRKYLLDNNEEGWQQLVPSALHPNYGYYKQIVQEIEGD